MADRIVVYEPGRHRTGRIANVNLRQAGDGLRG